MKKIETIINCIYWIGMSLAALLICVSVIHAVGEEVTEKQIEEAARMAVIMPTHTSAAERPDTVLQTIELETEITYADNQMQPVEIAPVYDIPLAAELQNYIIRLSEQYRIHPELVLAVIEKESGYNAAATGDSGNSQGLMQIQPRWHKERMTRLSCADLYDPWQNVTVGIDILADLLRQYQTVEMALMVYNAGATGAQEMWFSQGIYSNEYSRTVLEHSERLACREIQK